MCLPYRHTLHCLLGTSHSCVKVQKAFELYSTDDIDGALVLLLDIEAKKEYDKAYVARFIAVMYATKGNQEEKAISYLKQAVEPDVLNEVDHGEAIKLLADLQMQTKKYKEALKYFQGVSIHEQIFEV